MAKLDGLQEQLSKHTHHLKINLIEASIDHKLAVQSLTSVRLMQIIELLTLSKEKNHCRILNTMAVVSGMILLKLISFMKKKNFGTLFMAMR